MDPAEAPQPRASDRWTWLVIAAHTQLRLLRQAASDLRRPWENPAEPGPNVREGRSFDRP